MLLQQKWSCFDCRVIYYGEDDDAVEQLFGQAKEGCARWLGGSGDCTNGQRRSRVRDSLGCGIEVLPVHDVIEVVRRRMKWLIVWYSADLLRGVVMTVVAELVLCERWLRTVVEAQSSSEPIDLVARRLTGALWSQGCAGFGCAAIVPGGNLEVIGAR